MAPRPEKFDCKPGEYEKWTELCTASFMAMDMQRRSILDAFTTRDRSLKTHDIDNVFIDELGASEPGACQAKKMLYVHIVQHTRAAANWRVKSNGVDQSFETWGADQNTN